MQLKPKLMARLRKTVGHPGATLTIQKKKASKTCLAGVLGPRVFYNLRFEHVGGGGYFASFLIETLGGKVPKPKRPWAFPFQAKTREGF